MYIGRDAFLLYPEMISSPNTIIFGEVGTQESGLVNVYVPRQILHGKQGFILDVKGE